jgi:hypothetical protein
MDENQETSAADALTKAAEEAVADQEITQETEETEEETQEEVADEQQTSEELDDEGLPKDHGKRSDLGRKVTATHRRIDELTTRMNQIAEYLEQTKASQEQDYLEDSEPDEPITRRDLEKFYESQRKREMSAEKSYQENYVRTISGLGSDLSQDEYDGVLAEMKELTYDPSNDPGRDAEMNFLRAERVYLRKKMAQPAKPQNPLKGKKPASELGVATSQTGVKKEAKQPSLDADAQSYLDFVRRTDGDDRARVLLKE